MDLWIDDLRKTSVTKTDLCTRLTEHMGLTMKEARELVEGFFDILGTELKRGNTVKLAQFGTFQIRTKAARPGRNLRTQEPVEVNARRSVRFSTGPKLRAQLKASEACAAEANTPHQTSNPKTPKPPTPETRKLTPKT